MSSLSKKYWFAWGGLFLLVMLGTMLGFWIYMTLWLQISLEHQAGHVRLPKTFHARVVATDKFNVWVNGKVKVDVPVDQMVDIPLIGTYASHVNINTPIALNFKIHLQKTIPVNTFADLETTTALLFPKPVLPIKLRVPLQINVPVDIIIPVHTTMQLAYQGPISINLNETIQVPIQTHLKSVVPLHHQMTISSLKNLELMVFASQKPVAIKINSKIRQPLQHLKLVKNQPAASH